MKVVDEKTVTHKILTIELDEIVLQALANFIGPTSINDRKKHWKMNDKENESLADFYVLLSQNEINSNNTNVYPFD